MRLFPWILLKFKGSLAAVAVSLLLSVTNAFATNAFIVVASTTSTVNLNLFMKLKGPIATEPSNIRDKFVRDVIFDKVTNCKGGLTNVSRIFVTINCRTLTKPNFDKFRSGSSEKLD